jgi:hypothetical protein
MEEYQTSPDGVVEMIQKPTAFPSFLGRRSYIPRPISNATEFDLDNDSDSDSTPASLTSRGNSSTSGASSPGLKTPHTAGLGGFEFHFDNKTVSPANSVADITDSLSPEYVERPKEAVPELLPTARPQVSGRPFTALNQAVAELDETQVRRWRPEQVAEWMSEAGFDASVVEKFVIHDISGSVLIDLQFEDLKELDISSFGKRHRVMSSIHQLRNSSLLSDTPLSRSPSKSAQQPRRASRALTRSVAPEERHIIAESRSRSRRRGRQHDAAEVTPAESVSIVAIEQLLPKPHSCSKGEDCSKWRKYQRKIQRIQEEFSELQIDHITEPPEERRSTIQPSVVGSSDILGPNEPISITPELLNEIQARDPQESIRQFLNFQHVHNSGLHGPSPPPSSSATFAARSTQGLSEHLKDLPKLTIPDDIPGTSTPYRTPLAEFSNSSQLQDQLKHQLRSDPFHYGGVASPADIYRINTPMSASDIPVTMHPEDPIGERYTISQSVPPEMRYGGPSLWTTSGEPIERSQSTAPLPRRRTTLKNSFAPAVAPVQEDLVSVSPTKMQFQSPTSAPRPSRTSTDVLSREGWMRKRRTDRKIRSNEWSDNYFRLSGTRLVMLESDHPSTVTDPLETINVGNYSLHAYNVATSSKLSAAFKRSILGSGYMASEPRFAFSLIPDSDREKGAKLFKESNKSHHFAVKSGPEKVEWMRRLMLAKAASRNASGSAEF